MIFKKLILILSFYFLSSGVYAAFVDTDTYCRNYGCVVVSDNNTSDVYDVYNYRIGSTVPVGSELNDYGTNPVAGSGTVDPLFTNTNTNVSSMAGGQANRLQINNQVGGGVFNYPASGLLDASTTLTKFGIQSATKIDYASPGSIANLGDNPQSHSFYITSRGVSFNIRATAVLNDSNGEFAETVPGNQIEFLLNLTPSGTVSGSGQLFGTRVNSNYQFVNVNGLSLSSLSNNPIVAAFNGNNIYSSTSSGDNIYAKSVRLNAIYTLPDFSLSQGRGDMIWKISFSFWRK